MDPIANAESVLAVHCEGTSYRKMAERAGVPAKRALRLLRITLLTFRFMPGSQLRFRLGEFKWFDDSIAAGWSSRPDERYEP